MGAAEWERTIRSMNPSLEARMQRESQVTYPAGRTVKAGSSIPGGAWPQLLIAVLDPNAACSLGFAPGLTFRPARSSRTQLAGRFTLDRVRSM